MSPIFRFSLLAGLALAPLTAGAEDSIAQKLAVCAREEADAARLACFDAVAAEVAAATTPTEPPPAPTTTTPAATESAPAPATTPASSDPAQTTAPTAPQRGRAGEVLRNADGHVVISGNWMVSRTVDSMTDRPRVTLLNEGEIEQGPARDHPVLVLRCFQGQLEAFINVGGFIGTYNTFTTRLRFDRAEPITQRWNASTTGTAVFSPDPRRFVERLAQSERLLVEVVTFNGDRYRARFDLAGMAEALPEIDSCRRPAQQSPQRRRPQQR